MGMDHKCLSFRLPLSLVSSQFAPTDAHRIKQLAGPIPQFMDKRGFSIIPNTLHTGKTSQVTAQSTELHRLQIISLAR